MHDRLALSAPFSGRACGSVLAALAACAAFASPGAAQSRIKGANAAQVVVLGETPAARCYQEARRGAATRDAVEVCDAAFDGALTSRDAVATSVNRAIILQARGAYDAALADLAEARSRAPDFAPVHFNEGAIFIALERWADAEAAFDRALALDTAEPHRAAFGRAVALEEQGDLAGAYAGYQTAAELAPEWEAPRLELGRFRVERPSRDAGADSGS